MAILNGMCPRSPETPVVSRVFELPKMGPVETKIVQLEKDAFEKWYAGDPSAYIAIL